MDGIRRGLAMAAAHAVRAALARVGNDSSDIRVRRQAMLAPVAVPAIVPARDSRRVMVRRQTATPRSAARTRGWSGGRPECLTRVCS